MNKDLFGTASLADSPVVQLNGLLSVHFTWEVVENMLREEGSESRSKKM
jgi:hypothetical protein